MSVIDQTAIRTVSDAVYTQFGPKLKTARP